MSSNKLQSDLNSITDSVETLRLNLLFGRDSDNNPELYDEQELHKHVFSEQLFLQALSFLELAHRNLKLAAAFVDHRSKP